MENSRFDALVRTLALAAPRRSVIAAVLGGALVDGLPPSAPEAGAKKRKKKKKKKPPACAASCLHKVCGQSDGCGGKCTVQAGCETDEACVNGECQPNVCAPACTGNQICQPGGSCACPAGLKECPASGGMSGFCHECCIQGSGTSPNTECIGSAKGPYCREDDGDLINRCTCYPGQQSCGGGACGVCCDTADCFFDVFGEGHNVDSGRDCNLANETTGELTCQCRTGFTRCGSTSVCAAPDDLRLCGPTCMDCSRFPGLVCRNDRCCVPAFGSCQATIDCCAGLTCQQQTVAPFAFVCA